MESVGNDGTAPNVKRIDTRFDAFQLVIPQAKIGGSSAAGSEFLERVPDDMDCNEQ